MGLSVQSFKAFIQKDLDSKSQKEVLERIEQRREELKLPKHSAFNENGNQAEQLAQLRQSIQDTYANENCPFTVVTSGSTGTPKLIPVTSEFINSNHFKVAKQCLFHIWKNFGLGLLRSPKFLIISGYAHENGQVEGVDISYALASSVPQFYSSWNVQSGQFQSWQARMQHILNNVDELEKVTVLVGMPTWIVQLLKELEQNGHDLRKTFPNLRLVIHSGVSIAPYLGFLQQRLGSHVSFCDVYNASEGFFGFQIEPNSDDFQLSLNSDIYYHFLNRKDHKMLGVESVRIEDEYELFISTWDGLENYPVGDLVRVTGKNPLRIKLLGRSHEFINAFGEHINAEQVVKALSEARKEKLIDYHDYIMVPMFADEGSATRHQIFIELNSQECDFDQTSEFVDQFIRFINPHFKKKRENGVIDPIEMIPLRVGAFKAYYESNTGVGAQVKLSRLHNDRKILSFFNDWLV